MPKITLKSILNHRPTDSQTHRLTDSPTHRLTDSPTHRPTDSPTHRPTDSPTNRQTDSPTHRFTDSPNHRQTDSPTHRFTDSPTNRLTDSPTNRLTDSLILFIIATIPLPYASVQPSAWTLYAVLIFLLFTYGLWRDQLDFGFIKSPLLVFSLGLFFVYTLLQVLPVPQGFLRFLNPFQYRLIHQSDVLLGVPASWHSLSYVPSASFARWIFLLSLFLFFIMLRGHLTRTRHVVTLAKVILGVALFQALYGLLQALLPTHGVLGADIRAYLGDSRGTFINRNHFAGFIEMIWPVGLGLILANLQVWKKDRVHKKSWIKRIKMSMSSDRMGIQLIIISTLLFIFLALLFSKSRAGIMGAFIGFVSFVLLVHIGGKRFSWPAWTGIGLGVAFLLLYGGAIGYERIIERFLAIEDHAGSRINIYKDTWAIIKDHPFGIGLGNYEHVMPVYNTLGPHGINYSHTHNDYLQLLAEAGWPGFIALVGGFYLFLAKSVLVIRRFGSKMNPERFYITVGAISGLISMAFHSFFDFNLQIPANMLYFVVLMAIVISNEQRGWVEGGVKRIRVKRRVEKGQGRK